MVALLKEVNIKEHPEARLQFINHDAKTLVFEKGGRTFAFNFHPFKEQKLALAAEDGVLCPVRMNTERCRYGGRLPDGPETLTVRKGVLGSFVEVVLSPRSAIVF